MRSHCSKTNPEMPQSPEMSCNHDVDPEGLQMEVAGLPERLSPLWNWISKYKGFAKLKRNKKCGANRFAAESVINRS